MSIKLSLPTFDGLKGPVQAQQFIDSMATLFQANDIQANPRRIALASAALTPESPASLWLTNRKLDNGEFTTWNEFATELQAEFCRPLTVSQNLVAKKQLLLKAGETTNIFFQRVKYYHHNRDFQIPAATKTQQAYRDGLNNRIKETFIEGLPSSLLTKMAAVNFNTVTNDQLIEASLQAQALLPSSTTPSAATAPPVDVISQRGRGRGRGGFRGRGRGRGFPQRRGDTPQRRPGPSQAELDSRPWNICGTCQKRVKHRSNECFRLLPSNFPSFSRQVAAVTTAPVPSAPPLPQGPPNPTPTTSNYADPLNGFLG